MPFDRLAFHRLECPGSDMKRQFFPSDPPRINSSQNFRSKMQTRCRSGHRTFYLGINRLIGLQITFLGFTVQIRRDRQYARCIQQVGKRASRMIPCKLDEMAIPAGL
ncbi:uncharacterized protein BN560_02890 [Parabacteroides johnsonii CAG:246]|nr:uncharacterized protein BN560_02890 [Parabacteroides johnsonii CAG:246]